MDDDETDCINFGEPLASSERKLSRYRHRRRVIDEDASIKDDGQDEEEDEMGEEYSEDEDENNEDDDDDSIGRPYQRLRREIKSLNLDVPRCLPESNLPRTRSRGISEKHFVRHPKYKEKPRSDASVRIEDKSGGSNGLLYAMIAITLIIIVAAIGFKFFKESSSIRVQKGRDIVGRWKKSFDELVAEFHDVLPETSRKVIRKSIEMVLKRDTPSEPLSRHEPSVILLIGSKFNSQAVRCIFLKLSRSISETFGEENPPVLQAEKLSDNDLHTRFQETLGAKNLHTIIVDGIERFDGLKAQSLHRYTDHEHAVYRDVVILLTAYTNERLDNSSLQYNQMDKIANEILEVSWSNSLPEEQIAALLSRLTPSVAIITDDSWNRHWTC